MAGDDNPTELLDFAPSALPFKLVPQEWDDHREELIMTTIPAPPLSLFPTALAFRSTLGQQGLPEPPPRRRRRRKRQQQPHLSPTSSNESGCSGDAGSDQPPAQRQRCSNSSGNGNSSNSSSAGRGQPQQGELRHAGHGQVGHGRKKSRPLVPLFGNTIPYL